MGVPSVFDLTPSALAALLAEHGQPAYRARQVLHWAYRGATTYDQMSDVPAGLRTQLGGMLPLATVSEAGRTVSADGLTCKLLLRLHDGALVETVRMVHPSGKGRQRTTICVSSQAGCAYGCRFCATGQQGYGRNLATGEILEQVCWWLRDSWTATSLAGHRITNIVFMGMGEPFANYEAVRRAVGALTAPWGLGLAARHITVSTVGLAREIRRFAQEPWQAGLAVSLHAANDALRSRLVPVNRKYPLAELMAACHEYLACTRRRITFEYVLLSGVNDSPQHGRELGHLLTGLLCHVNLIPVNPTGDGEFQRPSQGRIQDFVREVRACRVLVTLRETQGVEIQAGCGQLRAPALGGATAPGAGAAVRHGRL